MAQTFKSAPKFRRRTYSMMLRSYSAVAVCVVVAPCAGSVVSTLSGKAADCFTNCITRGLSQSTASAAATALHTTAAQKTGSHEPELAISQAAIGPARIEPTPFEVY